jgi:hypothetical protein
MGTKPDPVQLSISFYNIEVCHARVHALHHHPALRECIQRGCVQIAVPKPRRVVPVAPLKNQSNTTIHSGGDKRKKIKTIVRSQITSLMCDWKAGSANRRRD